jgi:hypothetical protein
LDRPGLQQIEAFTLWNTLHDIYQHYVREFLIGNPQSAIRTDVSGAHNRNFLSQGQLLNLGEIAP